MKSIAVMALCLVPVVGFGQTDPTRVLADGKRINDPRFANPKTLNDYFPMKVPATRAEWDTRRQALREQVLLANGLWPLPPRTELKPVVHGKIDRGDYTVEKVFFASLPGHYVSGNLYRPKKGGDKRPAVLCPHGHWANGRLYEANANEVQAQRKQGAEQTEEGARYPLQARCAQLARMGCVVFFYDMVGYADSKPLDHRGCFLDSEAQLRLQSMMGLQTWNSIRALDFLVSLPDVDPQRVGVTGASGGGTQTFILGAVDDRPAAAFPAVMVSTAMQGGCVCENCSYLRVDAGNIDLAALFAPKPLAMSGAKDWTIDIETKGLPELKAVYRLYGAEDKVLAKCFPEFGHNYNQVSRELMYNWFNTHLNLGQQTPVKEQPFQPIAPKDLMVFDADHPRPGDTKAERGVRQYLTETSDAQINALMPKDGATLAEYRRVIGTALRTLIGDGLPNSAAVETRWLSEWETHAGASWRKAILARKNGEQVPAVLVKGDKSNGTVVLWVHPEGKRSLLQDGQLTPAARQILASSAQILAIDVLGVGEMKAQKPMPVDKNFPGFTFGYNRSLLANRVRDILTAVAAARQEEKTTRLHLIGVGAAGPWVMLARGLCDKAVDRTAADVNQFQFDRVRQADDEMMLPGALKYGGLGAFAGLAAPGELLLHDQSGTGIGRWLRAAFAASGASEKFQRSPHKLSIDKVLDWVLR